MKVIKVDGKSKDDASRGGRQPLIRLRRRFGFAVAALALGLAIIVAGVNLLPSGVFHEISFSASVGWTTNPSAGNDTRNGGAWILNITWASDSDLPLDEARMILVWDAGPPAVDRMIDYLVLKSPSSSVASTRSPRDDRNIYLLVSNSSVEGFDPEPLVRDTPRKAMKGQSWITHEHMLTEQGVRLAFVDSDFDRQYSRGDRIYVYASGDGDMETDYRSNPKLYVDWSGFTLALKEFQLSDTGSGK